MDTACLKIKFTPLLQEAQKSSEKCCLEIVPEISCIQNLDKLTWKQESNFIEYSIPMTYKIILRKHQIKDIDDGIAKTYHSCVDLLLATSKSNFDLGSGDLSRIISDTFVINKITASSPKKDDLDLKPLDGNLCKIFQSDISTKESPLEISEVNNITSKEEVINDELTAPDPPQPIVSVEKIFCDQFTSTENIFSIFTNDIESDNIVDISRQLGLKPKLSLSPICSINTQDTETLSIRNTESKGVNCDIFDFQKDFVALDCVNNDFNDIAKDNDVPNIVSEIGTLSELNSIPNSMNSLLFPFRDRSPPEIRIAQYVHYMEKELHPLSVTLNELIKKCNVLASQTMNNRAVVDQILRNLDFDLETVPKHSAVRENGTSSSRNDPLSLKIKVRKKDYLTESYNQGFISNDVSEPEMVLHKVRLVNSGETIMTFDMFMEPGDDTKTSSKPRKIFGSCLGGADDEGSPSERHNDSKSDGILRQRTPLGKHTSDESFGHSTRREINFLGQKCKPGGCLDPPFSEDRYSYKPHAEEPITHETKLPLSGETDIDNIKQDVSSKSPEIKDNVRRVSKTPIENKKAGSILNLNEEKSPKNVPLVYSPDKDSGKSPKPRLSSENKDSKSNRDRKSTQDEDKPKYPILDASMLRSRTVSNEIDSISTTSENKPQYKPPDESSQQVHQPLTGFFSPPRGMKRESTQRNSIKSQSNIPVVGNEYVDYPKISIPGSVSLDSVPLEQITDKIIDHGLIDLKKIPDDPNKPESDQKYIEPKQIQPILVPIPIQSRVPDENITPNNIDLPTAKLNADSSKSPELEKNVSSIIIVPTKNDSLTNNQNEEINDEGIHTPISSNSDMESINKEVDFSLSEGSPSVITEATNDTDNASEKHELSYSDNKNKDIEPNYKTEQKIDSPEPKQKIDEDNQEVTSRNSSIISFNKNTVIEDKDETVVDQPTILGSATGDNLAQGLENDNANIDLTLEEDAKERLEDENITSSPPEPEKTIELLKEPDDLASQIKQSDMDTGISDPDTLNENADEHAIPQKEEQTIQDEQIENATENVDEQDQVIQKVSEHIDQDISKKDVVKTPSSELPVNEIIGSDRYIEETFKTTDTNALDKKESPIMTPFKLVKDTSRDPKNTERSLIPVDTKWNESIIGIQDYKESATIVEIDSNNIEKPSPETITSNRDIDKVSLNLAFHTYLNNQKERILSTIHPDSEVNQHPRDSIILINTQLKLSSIDNYHGLVIPIDSKHDISLELKETNNKRPFKDNSLKTKPVPKLLQRDVSAKKPASEVECPDKSNATNEIVPRTLADIYKKELVPLQLMIKHLKQEVDALAVQQSTNKKQVVCLKKCL